MTSVEDMQHFFSLWSVCSVGVAQSVRLSFAL